jgi:hypothetical protein
MGFNSGFKGLNLHGILDAWTYKSWMFFVLGLLLFGKKLLPSSYGLMDLDLEFSHIIDCDEHKNHQSVFSLNRQQNIYYILVKFETFNIRAVWFV